MYDQINGYFEIILSNVRRGFRKGYSVQHWLIVLIEKCCKFLDKVFHCIAHELLIAKMVLMQNL